jgi:Na+/H+-translocating membrane pyrophosphatase
LSTLCAGAAADVLTTYVTIVVELVVLANRKPCGATTGEPRLCKEQELQRFAKHTLSILNLSVLFSIFNELC